jgi:hypothetical protein
VKRWAVLPLVRRGGKDENAQCILQRPPPQAFNIPRRRNTSHQRHSPPPIHPRAHPSAATSSVLQRPSGASMAAAASMAMVAGSSVSRAVGRNDKKAALYQAQEQQKRQKTVSWQLPGRGRAAPAAA